MPEESFWTNPQPVPIETSFDVSQVQAFHQKLPGYTFTPLRSLPDLARELQVRHVFLKDESQRLGLPAFKIMGASWGTFRAVTSKLGLSPTEDIDLVRGRACCAGIVLFTATDGNHGRAIAFMARLLGIKAVIYVPTSMDDHTKGAISDEGATIKVSGDYDTAVREAASVAASSANGILVQDTGFEGYEEIPMWIIEGYSTIFHEVDDEMEALNLSIDLVITPVGVGSLAHSVVRHYKKPSCSTKVVSVEPQSAACLNTSLHTGKPTTSQTSYTIMDGMNCGTVSTTAWHDLQNGLDASTTISDQQAHQAVEYLDSYSISAGPCGASGVAALRYIATDQRKTLGITNDSVVLLLNTEGKRPYPTP